MHQHSRLLQLFIGELDGRRWRNVCLLGDRRSLPNLSHCRAAGLIRRAAGRLRRSLDAACYFCPAGSFAAPAASAAGGEDRSARGAYAQGRPKLDEPTTRKTLLQNILLEGSRRISALPRRARLYTI